MLISHNGHNYAIDIPGIEPGEAHLVRVIEHHLSLHLLIQLDNGEYNLIGIENTCTAIGNTLFEILNDTDPTHPDAEGSVDLLLQAVDNATGCDLDQQISATDFNQHRVTLAPLTALAILAYF